MIVTCTCLRCWEWKLFLDWKECFSQLLASALVNCLMFHFLLETQFVASLRQVQIQASRLCHHQCNAFLFWTSLTICQRANQASHQTMWCLQWTSCQTQRSIVEPCVPFQNWEPMVHCWHVLLIFRHTFLNLLVCPVVEWTFCLPRLSWACRLDIWMHADPSSQRFCSCLTPWVQCS